MANQNCNDLPSIKSGHELGGSVDDTKAIERNALPEVVAKINKYAAPDP